MKFSREREGEILALIEVFILGMIAIWAGQITSVLPPFFGTGLTFVVAGLFSGILIFFHHFFQKKKDFFSLFVALKQKQVMWDLFWVTIIIVVLVHGLTFWGISLSSPGNAAILVNSEILFTALLFWFWGETLNRERIFGIFLIISGALVLAFEKESFSAAIGDVILLIACIVAPFGNFFQKRLIQSLPSLQVIFLRSLFGGIILIFFSLFVEQGSIESGKVYEVIFPLLFAGIFGLCVSKILLLEAFARIGVTKAITFNAAAPLVTLSVGFLFFGSIPTAHQIIAFVFMFAGVFFTIEKKRKEEKK